MMPYWQRVVLGCLLGLLALFGLWYAVGVTWVTATAAGILAPLAFLGSFFLFTADRPKDGYEQVLFDTPNTVLAFGMLVVFAGAGVATGLMDIGGGAEGRPMAALAQEFEDARDGFATGDVDPVAGASQMDALLAELGEPGEAGPAPWLAKALAAQKACFADGDRNCQPAFDYFIEYRLAGGAS